MGAVYEVKRAWLGCAIRKPNVDFVLNFRSGKDTSNYDFVVGGVANDKVFNTVELFFDGLIDKREAISLDVALDFFYHSEVYLLMRDGVSDITV